MNRCIFEPMNGRAPECDGVCKKGSEHCTYYFVDPVYKIMRDWKEEAGVNSPILWEMDYVTDKLIVCTIRSGLLIGKSGALVNKYRDRLNEIGKASNGVSFVEASDWIE